MIFLVLKFLHVLGAAVVLGTGVGITFFMATAVQSKDPAFIARTAANVVKADFVFIFSALCAQPLTGFWLADELGLPVFRGALAISLLLYVLLGFLWLPVLWLHKRMGELAADSAAVGASLPPAFRGLYRLWSGLGWAALGTLLAIFWQMVARL